MSVLYVTTYEFFTSQCKISVQYQTDLNHTKDRKQSKSSNINRLKMCRNTRLSAVVVELQNYQILTWEAGNVTTKHSWKINDRKNLTRWLDESLCIWLQLQSTATTFNALISQDVLERTYYYNWLETALLFRYVVWEQVRVSCTQLLQTRVPSHPCVYSMENDASGQF
jgi:hypothetical protein